MFFFEVFPWHKNFDTGISIIDEQHRMLVDILNKLASHLANRSNAKILNNIFDELANYADYHFKTEEKIWSAHFKDDVWSTSHERTHESFINDVLALKAEENQKSLDAVIHDIVFFLTRWLAYHILDSDKRMAKAVNAMALGDSIEQAKNRANEEMNSSMPVLINTVLSMYDNLSSRTMDLVRERTLRQQAEAALHLSEERWDFILEGGSQGVWDWNITQENASYAKETDSLSDFIGDKLQEITDHSRIHPDDIERVRADIKDHLDGKTEIYTNKHRILHHNNHYIWVLSRGKIVSRDEKGNPIRMVGTNLDITAHELATLIYQYSSQGMFVTDTNNNIISMNPSFTAITGYTEQQVIGKNPSYLSSGIHDSLFYKQMWESITNTGGWSGEIWNKRQNGEIYPEYMDISTVTDDNGFLDHHLALFTDITERKKADKIILEQANYDSLTKLANRHLFQQNLQREIYKSNRSQLPLALLFIDLDHFKDINDTNGHDVGDRLLIEVAQRITACVRNIDAVARFGGDEYTVILAELEDRYIIELITQKIINSLQKPFLIDEHQVYISASIGITLYPGDSLDMISMLKHADQAMYKAKAKGRNCFSYFTQSMQEEALQHQKLIRELRNAIADDQLEVYYQPIINSKTNKICKAEALLRWNHPLQGMISPVDFIPLAEKSGLIIEIGDWVFKQVAQQLKLWIEKYDVNFQISINKSPVQFLSNNKHNHWLEYLAKLGLSTNHIAIEITEGLLLEDDKNIMNQLLQFRDAGIQVAIDDFGTGYSSLSYLKKFDIDYLKIDQSFIHNITFESDDMALSEAIIVMAHKLGLEVIAEGVETEQQLQLLIKAGCDYIQGYFISKPLSAINFRKLLVAKEL